MKFQQVRPDDDAAPSPANNSIRAMMLLQEAIGLLAQPNAEQPAGPSPALANDRLIRLPEVMQLTGLRRSAVYDQMQKGTFPRSVKIGPRAATWSESAVRAWIAKCLQAR